MFQFLLGPLEERRTAYIYEQIEQRLNQNLNSWILVPEQFSLSTERQVLQRFGVMAQQKVKVLSFSRLCNLFMRENGPLRMAYIDGAGKQILAARALSLAADRFTVLRRNLRQKGFSATLLETVSECKRYGVTPEALQLAAESVEEEEFSLKLRDIGVFYEIYQELLNRQSADAEENLSLLCDRLADFDFFHGTVFVHLFWAFTPVERKALVNLMHQAELVISLPYSKERKYGDIFFPAEKTMYHLRTLAEEAGMAEAEAVLLPSPREKDALSYLRARYFDHRAKPFLGEARQVFACECPGVQQELESAADTILRLCREENRRFSDFLILAREAEPYLRMMPMIFGRKGIRVFLDTRRSVAEKPFMRMLYGMVEILAHGYSYERVMKIARADLLPISRQDVDIFENYLLAVAPTHAMWHEETWTYAPGKKTFPMEDINATKETLLSGVRFLEKAISGTKTGGEIAGALLRWLKESGIADSVERKAKKVLEEGMPELSDEYQQTWQTALSVLGQIAAIMNDTPMTYARFAEVFEGAVDSISIGMTPQTLDCVTFSRVDRFRSSNTPVVLVLGMNEGVFPRGFMTEGFLSDSERQTLLSLGLELAPGQESRRKEEQLLIYNVLSAAHEQLWLFRPRFGRDGKELMPSPILQKAESLLKGQLIHFRARDVDPVFHGVEGERGAFDVLCDGLALKGGNKALLPPAFQALYAWFEKKEDYGKTLALLTEAMGNTTPVRLSKEQVIALYGNPLSLSASQLETYNGCAFRYFLTYGLFLKERELAGMEPKSKGSIQHAALYDYFSHLKDTGADFQQITKEDCFSQVSAMVKKAARENAELLYESSAYYQYIVFQMEGIAARTAWEVVKFYQTAAFRPFGLEMTIGEKGEIPSITVKDPQGETLAHVRGIIDRADSVKLGDTTFVHITDYKSSAKDLDVQLTKDGIELQPLLYADALCKAMDKAEPSGLVYLQMTDPMLTEKEAGKDIELARNKKMRPGGWVVEDKAVLSAYATGGGTGKESYLPTGAAAMLSREEMQTRMAEANARIQLAAMSILQGEIAPRPYRTEKHDACKFCNYSGICQLEICQEKES